MEGIEHYHFECVPSTHKWAKGHAGQIERLTLVTADEQTEGIGQFGRKWVSPKDNLYATFCFHVPEGWPEIVHAAQLLSLSTARVLIDLGIDIRLRFPNDLLIHGKKVGGVLCEVVDSLAIDSVGLNVNLQEFDQIDQPATSLAHEVGRLFDVHSLLFSLVECFQGDLKLFLQEGFSPFLSDINHLLIK